MAAWSCAWPPATGNGAARYGYDKAGRLSFSQDSWYRTRRFKYNTAGELTESINGVGGRTLFEYDVRGRLIRITDPLGFDPLAPVLGAGWDGNPYAYAGNNPLNASDPTGLRAHWPMRI
ncbi:hypothetical protein KKR91_01940 [Arthrobacter jiangjiafuii]|uniref:RHS repeat-associated core domain-containing protein n=1 Tax=Arthrobacter jiangjiafuii TaxID=2817475 RepID=A0A975M5Q4_9MICC|nr:hypothetical protein [Arthrobacter jiangjiafuii]MBP3044728.1 hypothetical protein [Arthrobacter jiangjiafuii]QWC10441.1 hypothetical protein KKR91_01940 [Arthrobacter jiangjiafuii]